MKDEQDRKELGDRIKRYREYTGFSQDDVSQVLGIPRTAVSHIENGSRKIDVLELQKIAKLFQCSLSELTGESTVSDSDESITMVARATEKLSEDDRNEVIRFAQFLQSKQSEEDEQKA